MKKIVTRNQSPTFSRWSRHNWSAFSSVGREVRIGVLAVSMLFGNVAMAWALDTDATDYADTLHLRELEVIVRRAYPARGTVLSTTIADSATIGQLPMPTIESALKTDAAIDVRERGALGVQADVALYGSSEDQTMIMLNGIEFTDARTGHQSNSLPIEVELIDKITVTTDIVGAGAYSGGINYVTRMATHKFLNTSVTGGDFGFWKASISAGTSANIGSITASASYTRSNGYKPNTDFNNLNLFSYATLKPHIGSRSIGEFEFQVGFQRREFGSYGFYSLKYPWQWERTQTIISSLRWHMLATEHWQLSAFASYRRNADLYQLYRDGHEAPSWYKSHNHHLTDNVQAGAQADYSWSPSATTSVGIDLTYNHIFSNVLGKEMDKPKKVNGYPNAFYTKHDQRTVMNYWLRHSQRIISGLHANASFNIVHSPYGTNFMWGAALSLTRVKNLTVDLSASRSMRLPTFTDLYYTAADHISNPDLKPEVANTVRLRASWRAGCLALAANTFLRHGTNFIDWTKPTADDLWHATQIGTVNTIGATASATISLPNSFLSRAQLSYGYLHSNLDSHGSISQTELTYLRGKLSGDVVFRITRGLELSFVGTLFNRTGGYFNLAGDHVPYPDYFVLDSRLSWQLSNVRLHALVTNLLNRSYCEFGGLTMPGRWFSAGVSINL